MQKISYKKFQPILKKNLAMNPPNDGVVNRIQYYNVTPVNISDIILYHYIAFFKMHPVTGLITVTYFMIKSSFFTFLSIL